jgi:hypothetical protein
LKLVQKNKQFTTLENSICVVDDNDKSMQAVLYYASSESRNCEDDAVVVAMDWNHHLSMMIVVNSTLEFFTPRTAAPLECSSKYRVSSFGNHFNKSSTRV